MPTITEIKRKHNPHQPVGRWIRANSRKKIYERDNYKCHKCGRDLRKVPRHERTLDHKVPVSRGGSNKPSNLRTACRSCNSGRTRFKKGKLMIDIKKKKMKKSLDAAGGVNNDKESQMSKSNVSLEALDDVADELEKSLVSDNEDPVIIDCPHCEEGITKSQVLAKAKGKKMVSQNNGGKNNNKVAGGSDGEHNGKTPKRPKGAKDKTGASMPGSYTMARKSESGGDAESDDDECVEKSDSAKCPKCGGMSKAGTMCKCGHSMAKSEATPQTPRAVGGTQWSMFVDTGEDERISKAIENQMLGGAMDRSAHNNGNGR